jgi:hypothetical protein
MEETIGDRLVMDVVIVAITTMVLAWVESSGRHRGAAATTRRADQPSDQRSGRCPRVLDRA